MRSFSRRFVFSGVWCSLLIASKIAKCRPKIKEKEYSYMKCVQHIVDGEILFYSHEK